MLHFEITVRRSSANKLDLERYRFTDVEEALSIVSYSKEPTCTYEYIT